MWDVVWLSWIDTDGNARWADLPVSFSGSSLTISVHLVDHVLQLGLRRVLAQRPHDCAELFGGDRAVTVLVE